VNRTEALHRAFGLAGPISDKRNVAEAQTSALLILPVALLAFRDPLHRLGDAPIAGFGAFGVGDPLRVLALAAWDGSCMAPC
jgi:hypothetical protein